MRILLLLNTMAVITALLLCPARSGAAHRPAHAPANTQAHTIETRYARISCAKARYITEFGVVMGAPRSANPTAEMERVGEAVDQMVFRVKALLGMYPPRLRFNVIILASRGEIKSAYRGLGLTDAVPAAFYRQKSHTIYLSLDNLTAGIFAHEVAHAVISASFATPPPSRMQEILARYVDAHLREK